MKRIMAVLMIIVFISGCEYIEVNEPTQDIDCYDIPQAIQCKKDVIDCTIYPEHKNCIEESVDDLVSNWVVNEEYNEEVYDWIKSMQLHNGLQASHDDPMMVSTYDNALAVLIYSMYEDFERAEQILDFFDDRIESELEDEYGGFAMFHLVDGTIYGGVGRRWLGDNAWLLVSIEYYHYKTNTTKYADLATSMEQWIRSLQQEDGSLMSGVDEAGTPMDPVTEAMIDSYNAVFGYDEFHTNLLDYLEHNRYDSELNVLISWPGNPAYEYAIDMSSWGYLAMNDMPVSVLAVADDKFYLTEGDVSGYCIDEDLDAIWPEHTLQMAVAYITAGEDYYDQASDIIQNMEKLFIEESPTSMGLPYATQQATMYGTWELWDGVDTDVYLSSSVWYLFAKLGLNPFEPGLINKEEYAPDTVFYNK